jgi:uncharacterized protein YxjI
MRQQLVSIGEDFDIADEHGNPVYRVDGKALRLRETFERTVSSASPQIRHSTRKQHDI